MVRRFKISYPSPLTLLQVPSHPPMSPVVSAEEKYIFLLRGNWREVDKICPSENKHFNIYQSSPIIWFLFQKYNILSTIFQSTLRNEGEFQKVNDKMGLKNKIWRKNLETSPYCFLFKFYFQYRLIWLANTASVCNVQSLYWINLT